MCPFEEQQLDRLLKQPMPNLEAGKFHRQTCKKAYQVNKQRLSVLLIFSIFGFLSLLWFFPFANINQALSQLNFLQINSIQVALMSAMPLFMVALVGYFIKDELY